MAGRAFGDPNEGWFARVDNSNDTPKDTGVRSSLIGFTFNSTAYFDHDVTETVTTTTKTTVRKYSSAKTSSKTQSLIVKQAK